MATRFAKRIAAAARPILGWGPVTLVAVAPGARTAGAQSAGTNPTTVNYRCKGRIRTQADVVIRGGGLARVNTLMISILGATLPDGVEPRAGDRVERGSVSYQIVPDGVANRDGLGAVYDCAVRQL